MNAQISINFSSSLDIKMHWSEEIQFLKIPVLTSLNHSMGFSYEIKVWIHSFQKNGWNDEPVIGDIKDG